MNATTRRHMPINIEKQMITIVAALSDATRLGDEAPLFPFAVGAVVGDAETPLLMLLMSLTTKLLASAINVVSFIKAAIRFSLNTDVKLTPAKAAEMTLAEEATDEFVYVIE